MPAIHRIDDKAQLIITTWEGDATDVEFINAIKKYQTDIQNHPDYIHFNEVVDLTYISGMKLSTEGIKNIGKIAAATDNLEINRKLAIIVNSNLAFGLARMYETYRSLTSNSHKEICVFKNRDEAFAWVKKNNT